MQVYKTSHTPGTNFFSIMLLENVSSRVCAYSRYHRNIRIFERSYIHIHMFFDIFIYLKSQHLIHVSILRRYRVTHMMTDIKTWKMTCGSNNCKRKVYLLVPRLPCHHFLVFGRVSQVYMNQFGQMSRHLIRDILLLDIGECRYDG